MNIRRNSGSKLPAKKTPGYCIYYCSFYADAIRRRTPRTLMKTNPDALERNPTMLCVREADICGLRVEELRQETTNEVRSPHCISVPMSVAPKSKQL